jgi:glycosyltransferase involved in cell wall biosynthesis
MSSPNIVIFNGRLLPASETFVRSQAEGLHRFTPYYVGARRVPGLTLPSERTLVVNRGNLLGTVQEFAFKSWGVAPGLLGRVRSLQPALIHAHFGVCGTLALPLSRALQLPLMVTYHGFDACMTDEYARRDSVSTRVYLRRREALKDEAHLFIAVSDFIKNRLIEQGFSEDKICVHYIGVDTEIFQPDAAITREPVVLFVGRLTEKKGCKYLIQAMAQVQSSLKDAKLVIIGDGNLYVELRALAEKTLQNYEFLGLQPPDVVKAWMNKASVFCVPSIQASTGDCEGFGIVFAEAQAMGLPCVSFASGGIPEAIAHGETGFLAAERDWKTLAEYILQLLKEPNLWQQFSENGRNRVLTHFNLKQQTKALEDIYRAVLGGKF